MRVLFAGTGDAFGSGGRFQTCIHLSGASQVMLVDCGTTSMVALKTQGLEPNQITAVAVTHLHGDHFGGLPFLILDGQFSHRKSPLLVAGPPGIRSRLTEAMEVLFPGSSVVRRRFRVEVTELATDGTPADIGAAIVRGWQVEHPSGAPPLALRVDLDGLTFAYSGDTQWTPALADAARGADLFAAEAYTFDRPVRYHLSYLTLRAHLAEIAAKQTVLTHMSTGMLGRIADADLPAAYDGMTIALGHEAAAD
jgi:ribonuclease BN (tRNA processing enzyme)